VYNKQGFQSGDSPVRSHAVLRSQGTSLASTAGSRRDGDKVPTSGAVGGLRSRL
jgi:hypothetical protein